jgi:hypothetical protein
VERIVHSAADELGDMCLSLGNELVESELDLGLVDHASHTSAERMSTDSRLDALAHGMTHVLTMIDGHS